VGAFSGSVWWWDYGVRRILSCNAATAGGPITDLAYDPTGDHMAVGARDGSVLVVDPRLDRLVRRLDLPAAILSLDVSGTGLVVAASADDRLRGFDDDGVQRIEVPTTGALCTVRMSENGRGVLTAGSSGLASIWVTET
jgi:hypothetical protein